MKRIGRTWGRGALLAVLALWTGVAGALAETVKVADCARDAAIDYWASSDVEFCRKVMDEVFALAGVEPERSGFDAEGLFNPAEAEVVCSAFRTAKLLEDYDFPLQPLGRMRYGLYATPERADKMLSMPINDWPQLRVGYSPVSQGQEGNTDRTDYFERADLSPEYAEYRTSAGAVEGLRAGEVDTLFLYTPHGKRPEGLVEIVPLGLRNVYFAVRKDRPELLKRLSAAYREWYVDHIGTYDAWREELLGIPAPAKRVRIAAFTRGELFSVSPDGERRGSLEDWIRSLCGITRWEPDYVYGTFEQCLADVKSGRLDLMGGLAFTPERNGEVLFSHTACGMLRIYLWTRRNSPYKAGRPDTWGGMKLGVMAGTQSGRHVREQLEKASHGIELREYALEREMLDDYASGEIDACVDIEMQELAKERALRLYAAYQMFFVCSRSKPELFDELERALDALCEDYPKYLRLVRERHYGAHSEMSELTIAETEWLTKWLADPVPIVVDFSPWPFKVADGKGRPEGFPKSLIDELSRRTGLQFKPAPQTDFRTAEAKFLRGETAFWVPYPEDADEVRYGAVKAFSEPVPQRCADVFGSPDYRREFALLVRPEVDDELVSILRKTMTGISADQLQEMFLEAVAEHRAERRFFGLTDSELRDRVLALGSMLFALVLVYGAVMLVLLKRQAMRSEELAARAEDSANAKTRFLAMMSHELRTPLNAVIGFAEFLERKDLGAGRREEYLQGIITSSSALLDLINDILDLSKLETGSMRMRVGGCSVKRLMSELPAIFGGRAASAGVTLSVKRTGEAEVPDVVLSQQGFRQVLINLVGNSLKFTENGTITVEYGWKAESEGTGTLTVSIRDTGCGISEEKMEHLFDPFVQDISSRMEGHAGTSKGTGLGLPIVKRLVDAAGGAISAKSELGKGTEFRIVLPSLCVAEAAEKPAGLAGVAEGDVKVPGSVLVVDDIQINRKVLGIHLANLGVADVRFAENGLKALDAMRGWTPDIVLTDMWMPEMDGQKLSEAMAADPRLAGVPLVAITADVEVESTPGVRHFAKIIAKPVTNGKLRALFAELGRDGETDGKDGAEP